MNEIRLHGRGGLGTVKAAETLVHAAVMDGNYGSSIPFFGFERQGAPVTAYLKISKTPIRAKNRVYKPNVIVVLDATIMNAVDVFEGIEENTTFVINTSQAIDFESLPKEINKIAKVDATSIAIDLIGRPITNTVMLGAFIKSTELVEMEHVLKKVEALWGIKNVDAVKSGFNNVEIIDRRLL